MRALRRHAVADVQNQPPRCTVSLSRVGVTGVEKVIRIGAARRRAALPRRSSTASSTSGRSRRARTCRASRRSSTRRSARSSSARRALPGRDARPADRRARARPPGRAARRGDDRRALPRAQAGARHRASRRRRSTRSSAPRSPASTGTRRLVGVAAQGITACPCAQELVAGTARERLRADGFSDDEIERILEAVPVATHNQRGLGHAAHRLPRGLRHRHRGVDAAGDRRGLDVERDLRADEALRRGRGRREGPPPPALRRGLRARDDQRRRRALRRPGRRHVRRPPARRTSRRSTSTTSSPSASACSASCATSSHRRAPRAPHLDARVARRQLLGNLNPT